MPLGTRNLYIGGAGVHPEGYINLDLFAVPGVDVSADVEHLPFANGVFDNVECDAVLEHVRDAQAAMREIERITAPGGFIHVVTPFCHPFHEYPRDYRRFTLDGLKAMAPELEVLAEGWRTGPTATMLVFALEWIKMWFDSKLWRAAAHGIFGWILSPLRYLDLWLMRSAYAGRIGNHCYIWFRKPEAVIQKKGSETGVSELEEPVG
jgi:SAM-dependent methyltransferase